MADLQFYIDHARLFGPHFHIFSDEPVPEKHEVRRVPPDMHAMRRTLLSIGCDAVGKTSKGLCGTHPDGYAVIATEYTGGWLITGGPHDLLKYGVPDAAALARFPDVFASVQEHARTLKKQRGV